ncbi:arf-GAP domain and FG repeat-containing protein 1 isoform X2 [Phlebotomus papatasi]|uniref:arf-GAP domain and FG repeat-containing protein 1 isoform X2 n=1 Tax=Phlebotomus papatasi TaxID=29031 RepID=UPI00248370F3|nr:arf-GAP domain and FG repeat-containing protein 1 isoform X2 [Phlebotomus papatasi]
MKREISKMAVVRKKTDDKNLKILREIVSLGGNRQCFDCGQRGPTYINMTIGSFVCTKCSGMLRGITPPHRVKSISMATFTPDEIEFIRSHGNDECAKTWLGLWDPKRTRPLDQRELMIDKYERKRYYLEPASPLKSLASSQQLTTCATSSSSGTSSSTTTTTNVTLDNTAVLKSITLTPPQSLRLHNKNARSTTKGPVNFQHQFTPDSETGLFNLGNSQTRLNNNNNSSNGGGHQNGITSNLSGIVANNNNKFTPDADFVADFGSANIFNATQSSTTMVNNTANGTSKIVNGNVSSGQQQQINGNGGTNENFADFEHNPIYNSAGLPMSLSSSNSLNSSSGGFASNSSLNSTPSADRYAALKDLDEQLRETKEREAPSSNFQMGSSPNPFKNPFQSGNGVQWTTSESVFSPAPQFATNGFTNGYAKIPEATPQPQQFNNGSANFSFNPFATTSTHSTNPFL